MKTHRTDFNCDYSGVSKNCEGMNHGNDLLPTNEDIHWKLIDEDGWDKALANKGISVDYVEFGDYTRHQHHEPYGGRGRADYDYHFTNFPIKNKTMVVPNPKDIVLKALPHIPDLRMDMQATVFDMMFGQWVGGSLNDPSQVYSTPVFTIIQAIEGMAKAKKLGQEEKDAEEAEKEQKKKDLILTIVSIALIVSTIPGRITAPKQKKKKKLIRQYSLCLLLVKKPRPQLGWPPSHAVLLWQVKQPMLVLPFTTRCKTLSLLS